MPLVLPRVIGHRGAAATAPENTAAGFRHAAELGVTWVELDVQLSSDGVPVVFHDATLERTTNGRGPLVETPWGVLRRLDAGNWFDARFAGEPLPTLADTLDLLISLGLSVNIEIKADEARGAETARVGLAEARRHWPADRPSPLVSSFALSALAAARDVAADWPRGLLVDHWPQDWQRLTGSLGCVSLHLHHRELSSERVAALKDTGLAVLSYTVNDRALAERLWKWGVDAVFSDRPERLVTGASETHPGRTS